MDTTVTLAQVVLALSFKLNAQLIFSCRAFLCSGCACQLPLIGDQTHIISTPSGDSVTLYTHDKGYDECMEHSCPGCGHLIDGGHEVIFMIR